MPIEPPTSPHLDTSGPDYGVGPAPYREKSGILGADYLSSECCGDEARAYHPLEQRPLNCINVGTAIKIGPRCGVCGEKWVKVGRSGVMWRAS